MHSGANLPPVLTVPVLASQRSCQTLTGLLVEKEIFLLGRRSDDCHILRRESDLLAMHLCCSMLQHILQTLFDTRIQLLLLHSTGTIAVTITICLRPMKCCTARNSTTLHPLHLVPPTPFFSLNLCQLNSWSRPKETHWQMGGLQMDKGK